MKKERAVTYSIVGFAASLLAMREWKKFKRDLKKQTKEQRRLSVKKLEKVREGNSGNN